MGPRAAPSGKANLPAVRRRAPHPRPGLHPAAPTLTRTPESDNMLIVTKQFDSFAVSFTDDAYFNATEAASKYGRRPYEWLRLASTQEYIEGVLEDLNDGEGKPGFSRFESAGTDAGKSRIGTSLKKPGATDDRKSRLDQLTVTVKGGPNQGTWLHPSLVVAFTRWLDVRFSIWCDRQIYLLLTGRAEEALRNVEELKAQLANTQLDHALELRKTDTAAEHTLLRLAEMKTKSHISPLWSMDTLKLKKQIQDMRGARRFIEIKLETAEQILTEVQPSASLKIKKMLERRSEIIRTLEKGGVIFGTDLTQ